MSRPHQLKSERGPDKIWSHHLRTLTLARYFQNQPHQKIRAKPREDWVYIGFIEEKEGMLCEWYERLKELITSLHNV